MAEKLYRRVGRSNVVGKSTSVYVGKDHLIVVDTVGYTEEYRRFYFQDIQGITFSRTHAGKIWNIVLGLIVCVFAILGLASLGEDRIGAVIFWCIGAAFLLALVINWIKGPTCITYVKTAVQFERMGGLNRVRRVEKVLDKIRKEIEQVQGVLSPEEMATRLAQMPEPPPVIAATPTFTATPVYPSTPVFLRPYQSRMHTMLCVILLVDGLMSVLQIFWNSVPVVILGSIVTLIWAVINVIALLKQRGTDLRPALQRLTWVAGGYLLLGFIVGTVEGFVLGLDHPSDQLGGFQKVAEVNPFNTPWFLAILLFGAVSSIGLGTAFLLLLRRPRLAPKTMEIPPAPPSVAPTVSTFANASSPAPVAEPVSTVPETVVPTSSVEPTPPAPVIEPVPIEPTVTEPPPTQS